MTDETRAALIDKKIQYLGGKVPVYINAVADYFWKAALEYRQGEIDKLNEALIVSTKAWHYYEGGTRVMQGCICNACKNRRRALSGMEVSDG